MDMIGSGSSQPHLEHVCSGGWAHPLSMSGCLGRGFRNGCKEVNSPCNLFCKHVAKMKVSFGVVPLPPQRCVLMPSCARCRGTVAFCQVALQCLNPNCQRYSKGKQILWQ